MIDILKYIDEMQVMYGDKEPSSMDQEPRNMYNQGQLVQPNDDGSRPGYMGKYIKGTKNPRVFTGTKGLFTTPLADGTKMYEAHIISKNTDLGPAMKRRFPFTKQGKEDALKAMKEHKEKYPNISKKTVYRDQTAIQKGKDGVLKYQRKNQPTKYYDPKKYGSETKAFKAAEKDVAKAIVARDTSNQVDIDIKEIKKLRDKGFSQIKISKKLGVDQRTIADRLVKAGEYTRELNTRIVPPEIQKDIKGKYSQVKNWDFKKYTYGVSPTADIRMYDRIRRFVDEPKKFSIAVDFSTPQGWMAAQMDRSYKLGNTDYEPVRSKINNKNKIVGFIDNSQYGGGKKYIVAERFLKGKNADGVLFSNHVDFEDTKKFIDISKKAKLPVQGVLKDLLKNEGIDTTRISLSDLFKQMKNKVGYDGVKNALERHHISGVKNRATGNYQLLDRDLNSLAREVTKEIEQGDLSRVGELKKRGAMVEVGGQTYGGGPKTPTGQLKRFEKNITNFYQTDPQAKNILSKIAALGGKGCNRKVAFAGGRMNFDVGGSAACISKGLERLKNPTNLSPGENANLRALKEMSTGSKGVKILGNAARVLGKLGVVSEGAIGGLLALNDYAGGSNKEEIISNFTYGLAGKSQEEQLTEQDPQYGLDRKILKNYAGLNSMDQRKDNIGRMSVKPGIEKQLIETIKKEQQPFMSGPRNEEFDMDRFYKQQEKTNQADIDYQKAKDQRALERRVDPFAQEAIFEGGDFMAAGGGIAGLSGGDKSGRPPESGPASQGLRSLIKNGNKL